MSIASVPHLLSTELVHHITTNQENLNFETLFGTNRYQAGIDKRVIIASGVTVGATSTANSAINIPSGFNGKMILVNEGSILAAGGAANSGTGGNAITAGASNIFIDNRGVISAGGGGGGKGGTGGRGSYTYTYSCTYSYACNVAANICTCPVCCGYSCTNSPPCPGGFNNQAIQQNGCAEGGWRWFCPSTCTGTTTCTGTDYEDGTVGGNGGRGQGYNSNAASGSTAANAINNAGKGGTGGDGGGYGESGEDGDPGANGNFTNGSSGTGGGLAGFYIVNNANVTWIANGTQNGRVG